MDPYNKYIYDLAWRMSINDVLLFQDIEQRTDLVSILKLFIDRGVLEDDKSYIEFVGNYTGITRKSKLSIFEDPVKWQKHEREDRKIEPGKHAI